MEGRRHKTRKSGEREVKWEVASSENLTTRKSSKGNRMKLEAEKEYSSAPVKKDSEANLKLQLENDILLLQLSKLNDSLNHWKVKCQRQENNDVNLSKLKLVTKENQALKEDLDVLKSVIKRLNQEISFYQDRLRSTRLPSDSAKISTFSTLSGSNVADYEIIDPKKNLLPLLTAYDEVIEEKNEIIKDHELAMERFKAECREIIQENEELHKIIGESKEKGSIAIDEWKFLQENAITVLEENDLLHNQITILKEKARLTAENFEEKVVKHKNKITMMEEETVKLKNNIKDAQDQCSFLTAQISKMSQVIQQRIPVEEHDAAIRECKRLFEELKKKYGEEKVELADRIHALETEKERITNEMTDLDAENAKLRGNVRTLEESLCSSAAQLKSVQSEFTDSTKVRQVTADTMNEMMALAKTAIAEKESLENSFKEQRALNTQLMELRQRESRLVDELRDKIKLMENVHQEEMEKYRVHISKLEEVLETVGERHQADIMQFKELINEKTSHIEKLRTEKQQLMVDLETVWRATTRDARHISPLLKKYKDKTDAGTNN